MLESNIGAPIKFFDGPREGRFWSQPERVTLPSSGIEVVLCRPTLAYFRSRRSQWPADLLEKCDFQGWSGERGDYTLEERSFIVKEQERIIKEAFAQARVSLGPLPGGVESINLDARDTEFVMRYLIGPDSDADEPETVN